MNLVTCPTTYKIHQILFAFTYGRGCLPSFGGIGYVLSDEDDSSHVSAAHSGLQE